MVEYGGILWKLVEYGGIWVKYGVKGTIMV
jgi:hypothetical protein